MTQLEAARKGVITERMRRVEQRENVTAAFVGEQVAVGCLNTPAHEPTGGP